MRLFNTLCVIGLGCIGLPKTILFAYCPKNVIGVDMSVSVVGAVNHGELSSIEHAYASIIIVPTPLTVYRKLDQTLSLQAGETSDVCI